ncbi:MAG: hypothetical protein JW751_15935 [Polyangiaceae bacterium]|nr:hypothetical protein [Polyangiaceae bacterium]
MSPLRFALVWSLVTAHFAAVAACGEVAAAGDPSAGLATGGVCTAAACVTGNRDGGLDAVSTAIVRPDADEAPSEGTTLRALCGTGCPGAGGAGAILFPEDAGACVEAAGMADHGGAGGAAGVRGCSIVVGEGSTPVGQCSLRGSGDQGDPCIKQLDCAPGFACVGEDNAGQCRSYCCADPEMCPSGTFCAARPLLDREGNRVETPLDVPVCVRADACPLDEPYPCPTNAICTCPTSTACTVVRSDGTTGCVPVPSPGESGFEGDPCPCSPTTTAGLGFICSQTTQTCLALCKLEADASSCGVGRRCQSSASLPDGFGICTTTPTADAGR